MKRIILINLMIIILLFVPINTLIVNAVSNNLGISLRTIETTPGGRVYVDLNNVDSNAEKMNIYILGGSQYLTVEVKDIHTSNPYFIMPKNAVSGQTYTLGIADITDYNGNKKSYSTPEISFGNYKIDVIDISLNNISIKGSSQVGKNDKLYLDVQTSGNISYISVNFKNENLPLENAIAYIQNLKENPYIDFNKMSNVLKDGNYYISDVFLFTNENNIQYSKVSTGQNVLPLNFDVRFSFKNNTEIIQNTEEIIMNSINLKKTEAQLNEKVYVDISTNKKVKDVMLSFYNQKSNSMMVVNLKDLNTQNPYFIVPYTTECATYELNYAILKDSEGNEIHYRKGTEGSGVKHFDFNSIIEIKERTNKESDLMVLDNENITKDIINEISNLKEDISIEINANNNPIIDSALFKAIENSNKIIIIKYNDIEWVFSGKDIDIKEIKSIDVGVNIYKVEEKDELNISNKVDAGIIIEFAENGKLPGKCLIKIKSQGDILEKLDNKEAKVYYYNDNKDNFNKVKMHTILSNDYYEFYINHNSKYIMTINAIDEKYLSQETSDLELNETVISNKNKEKIQNVNVNTNTNKNNLEFIIKLVVAVVCIIILILIGTGKILTNKNKTKKEKSNSN